MSTLSDLLKMHFKYNNSHYKIIEDSIIFYINYAQNSEDNCKKNREIISIITDYFNAISMLDNYIEILDSEFKIYVEKNNIDNYSTIINIDYDQYNTVTNLCKIYLNKLNIKYALNIYNIKAHDVNLDEYISVIYVINSNIHTLKTNKELKKINIHNSEIIELDYGLSVLEYIYLYECKIYNTNLLIDIKNIKHMIYNSYINSSDSCIKYKTS